MCIICDKSAKKFNTLIKQTASDRAKRSSVGDNVQDEQVHKQTQDTFKDTFKGV